MHRSTTNMAAGQVWEGEGENEINKINIWKKEDKKKQKEKKQIERGEKTFSLKWSQRIMRASDTNLDQNWDHTGVHHEALKHVRPDDRLQSTLPRRVQEGHILTWRELVCSDCSYYFPFFFASLISHDIDTDSSKSSLPSFFTENIFLPSNGWDINLTCILYRARKLISQNPTVLSSYKEWEIV